MNLEEVFKFRLSPDWMRRADKMRKLRLKSRSEFGREALMDHIEEMERAEKERVKARVEALINRKDS